MKSQYLLIEVGFPIGWLCHYGRPDGSQYLLIEVGFPIANLREANLYGASQYLLIEVGFPIGTDGQQVGQPRRNTF